ncbi:hypothetical protein ABK040_006976 [Willaertia magna]
MQESESLIVNDKVTKSNHSMITLKIATFIVVAITLATLFVSIANFFFLRFDYKHGGDGNNQTTVKLIAGEPLNKGAPVTTCSTTDMGKKAVCLFQQFNDMSTILTKTSTFLYNDNKHKVLDTVQDLSNYKVKAYVQHLSSNQPTQRLVFYTVMSLDPVLAYTAYPLELTVEPFEPPLQANEYYQLLQVKLFSHATNGNIFTAQFVVSYARMSDGGKDYSSVIATRNAIVTFSFDTSKTQVVNYVRSESVGPQYGTPVNADLSQFIIEKDKVALGYTKINAAGTDFSFAIVYQRIGQCFVDTFTFVNSKLGSLKSQNNILTCAKGLKSFYFDDNTFLLMDMNKLMSVTIDSTNGNVVQKVVERVTLEYNSILLSVNSKVMYIGRQQSLKDKNQQKHEYVGVYYNTDTSFASVMKITFDGTKFTTNRIVPLKKPMKNLQISMLDNNQYQLTYERESLLKTRIMTFNDETPSDFTYYSPSLGVEFTVGTISPQSANLIVSDFCDLLQDNCLNLIQRKDNTVFDIADFDIPANSFPILGIALNNTKSGEEVEIAFSGIIDGYSNLKSGMKYYASSYYNSKTNILEGGLSVSGTFGDHEEDLVGLAISETQILLRNFGQKNN